MPSLAYAISEGISAIPTDRVADRLGVARHAVLRDGRCYHAADASGHLPLLPRRRRAATFPAVFGRGGDEASLFEGSCLHARQLHFTVSLQPDGEGQIGRAQVVTPVTNA